MFISLFPLWRLNRLSDYFACTTEKPSMFDFTGNYEKLTVGTLRKGRKRVLRGGSWNNNGRNLRSARRNANSPDNRNNNIGFRLAGACLAGGSFNQQRVRFCLLVLLTGRQIQGLRRVSRLLLNTCRQAAFDRLQYLFLNNTEQFAREGSSGG